MSTPDVIVSIELGWPFQQSKLNDSCYCCCCYYYLKLVQRAGF